MAEQYAVAIVYAAGSKFHRGGFVSPDPLHFETLCRRETLNGNKVLDLTNGLLWEPGRDKPISRPDAPAFLKLPNAGGTERLNQLIAAAEGIEQSSLPDPRAAVVDPETREVAGFIVADPVADKLEHKELYAAGDAKMNDKITREGQRLARVVTGARDGKVEAVSWIDAKAIPDRYVEDSYAKAGETVEALKLTDVDMGVPAERF